jgi:hypothetical protein
MQLLHLDTCTPDPDGYILNTRVDFGRTESALVSLSCHLRMELSYPLLSNTDRGDNQYREPFSFVCDRVRMRERIQPCGLGQAMAGLQVRMAMPSIKAMAAKASALGEPLECSKARH